MHVKEIRYKLYEYECDKCHKTKRTKVEKKAIRGICGKCYAERVPDGQMTFLFRPEVI